MEASAICAEEEPALIDRGGGHPSACHFAEVLRPLATADEPLPLPADQVSAP